MKTDRAFVETASPEGFFAGLKSSLGKVRQNIEKLLECGLACAHAKTSGTCQKLYWDRHRLWTFLDGPNADADPIDRNERSLALFVGDRKARPESIRQYRVAEFLARSTKKKQRRIKRRRQTKR